MAMQTNKYLPHIKITLPICVLLVLAWFYYDIDARKYKIKTEQNFFQLVQEEASAEEVYRTTNVFLLSSMPRSGSTMIGEFLSKYRNDTLYIFEPDQYIQKNGCLKTDSCTLNFFTNIYICNKDEKFEKWFRAKGMFFNFYNAEAKSCSDPGINYNSCAKNVDLGKSCQNSSLKLMKNIRTRLKIMEEMLKDNRIGLKIVHLTRDPRGSLRSINSFKWGVSEKERCEGLLEDLEAYQNLKSNYPDQVISLSYESFCLDPLKEAKRILKFLFSDDTLSSEMLIYAEKHLLGGDVISGPMSTVKDTKAQFDGWRWKIKKNYLMEIENISECKLSIQNMGYRLFDTIDNAQNHSLSLLNF